MGSFNPFIETLPVSEMVRVGMEKQNLYDQGLQRIQAAESSIDNLDIAKHETKQYVSSRLGELNTSLQKVAGADFSNQQLVNQVTGFASKIARDPIVQNGLISTANYRKGISEMEDAKKQGKSSPSNEFVFQKQAQGWLNDGKADSSFNASYTPYYDVDKDLREMVNTVGEDSYTAEQIFVTDKNGSILKNADGSPQLSPYATKQVVSGKGGQKLMDAISTVLNKPQVAKQVGIDGQYAFRNLDSKALAHLYYDTNVKTLEALKDRKDGISLQLSTASLQDQEELRKQLSLLDSRIEETQTSIQGGINDIMANPDPDNYRSSIYAQNLQNKYLSAFTTQKNATTYEENPGWNANMQMLNYRLSVQKENREAGQQTVDNYYKEKNYELDVEKANMEMLKWAFDPKNPNRKNPMNPTHDPNDYSQYSAFGKFLDDNQQLGQGLNDLKRQFVVRYNQEYAADQGKTFSEEDINKSIRQWAGKEGKTPEQWIDSYFEKVYPAASHGNFRYFSAKELTPQIDQALKDTKLANQTYEDMKKTVIQQVGEQNFINVEKLQKQVQPETIYGHKLSKEDLVQLAIYDKGKLLWNQVGNGQEANKITDKAEQYLVGKFGADEAGNLLKSVRSGNISDNYAKLAKNVSSEGYGKTLSLMNDYLLKHSVVLPDERYDIMEEAGGDAQTKDDIRNRIKETALKYQNANGSPTFEADKVASAVDKGTFSFLVNRSSFGGDRNKYYLEFSDEKGKPSDNRMEITAQDYKFIANRNNLPFTEGISTQDQTVARSKFRSTNLNITPSSKEAFNDAFYSENTIPNVKKYVVRANAQQTTDGDYRVYLYIKDRDGNVRAVPAKDPGAFRESRAENLNAVQKFLATLSDAKIDQLLNNN